MREVSARLARGVLVALGVVLSAAGAVLWIMTASSAADASDLPTIMFVGDGPAPLFCSSTPDPASLTIKKGTRVVLANFTGVDATIDVGGKDPVAVADGAAISVRLKEGEHPLRMVPNCLETFDIQAAVVTVVKAVQLPSVPPSPTPTGPGASIAPSGGASPPASSAGSPPAVAGSTPAGGVSRSAAPPVALGGPETSLPAGGEDLQLAGEPDVRAAAVVRPPSTSGDGRGARLLAVIATICVVGVSSAIIRAIVAQRTTWASTA